jgi:ankyrin repeat protein
LHWAVQRGRDDLARILVEHGASVTAQDNNGSTPLHSAASLRGESLDGSIHLSFAPDPLTFSAEATDRVQDRSTQLRSVARKISMDLARFFVERGADVAARDKDGSTPLDLAAQEGNVDLVRLLAEYGADGDGSTLSDLTVRDGREGLGILLAENGQQYVYGLLRPIIDQFLRSWRWVASSSGMA